MLTLTATAPELKSWAVAVAQLGDWLQDGIDYTDLNGADGEVQVFTDYWRRVSGGVAGGGGGVGAAGGSVPDQDPRFGLFQPPALGLFAAMVVSA
jgi:hypothetical protein